MTVGEFEDQVAYEGGITNIDAIGGATIALLKEALDTYANQTKYEICFVADVSTTLIAAQSSIPLQNDLQHLDMKHIRFQPGGVDTNAIMLQYQRDWNMLNAGLTCTAYRDSSGALQLFPNANVAAGDIVLYNYWKKPSTLLVNEASTIPIPQLIPALKAYVISRLQMSTGGKAVPMFMQVSQAQHAAHFGAVHLSDCNGE